jgi:uncharacterized RDD family membrane protein YckC
LATTEQRFVAYLIDLLLILVVGFFLGFTSTTAAWIAAGYLLLRDVAGASPGKLVLRLRVLGKGGSKATVAQRVLRNATLGLQALAVAITPLAGFGLVGLIVRLGPSSLVLVDALLLLAKGQRLSDKLVGTMVVSRSCSRQSQ